MSVYYVWEMCRRRWKGVPSQGMATTSRRNMLSADASASLCLSAVNMAMDGPHCVEYQGRFFWSSQNLCPVKGRARIPEQDPTDEIQSHHSKGHHHWTSEEVAIL